GKLCDFAKAQLYARFGRGVAEQGSDRRSVRGVVDLVQMSEIDQGAARRELVEAESLEASSSGFGGSAEARRASADDDDIVGRIPGCTNRRSVPERKRLDQGDDYT